MNGEYRTAVLLCDAHAMDDFIHDLAAHGLDNMTGSTHGNVRLCLYRRGILLVSYHHTSSTCGIMIAPNPKAKAIRGDRNSRMSGDPMPSLESGEGKFVCVWSNGIWAKGGPWEKKIRALLEEVIGELKSKIVARAEMEEAEKARREEEAKEKEDELTSAWS